MLSRMREAIAEPRPELPPHAPRFVTIRIRPEKIREVIGPGGKVVRGIQEQTGVKVDIEDDGKVTLFGADARMVQQAVDIIQGICKEAEVGRSPPRQGQEGGRLRRLRGDHAGHRGAAPHLPDRRGADAARRGRPARGRPWCWSRSSRSTRPARSGSPGARPLKDPEAAAAGAEHLTGQPDANAPEAVGGGGAVTGAVTGSAGATGVAAGTGTGTDGRRSSGRA